MTTCRRCVEETLLLHNWLRGRGDAGAAQSATVSRGRWCYTIDCGVKGTVVLHNRWRCRGLADAAESGAALRERWCCTFVDGDEGTLVLHIRWPGGVNDGATAAFPRPRHRVCNTTVLSTLQLIMQHQCPFDTAVECGASVFC